MDYLKEYINGLLLLILSLVLLSYFVSTIFRYLFTGIEVKKSNSIYYITYIYENTLATKNGIQVGGIVRKVNNKEPNENIRLKTFLRVEKIDTIDIVHRNNLLKYRVSYEKGDKQRMYHIISPTIFTRIVLFIIPNLILDKELITFELSAVFFIFIPVYSLCTLILKSFFDFDSIINRLQYYLLISFGISGFLFIINLIIFEKRREGLLEVIQFNILICISILIALYLKDYLDFTFRKILYNHKKNYTNSLNRFMHQTKKEYEVKKIIKFIKREVKDVLSVTNPICISVNNMSNKISFFEKEQSISLSKLHKFNWNSYGIGSIIYIEGYSVIIIAILPDYRVVLLAKGKKFNIDEIVWLETLANYANLQFECLRKIEILAKSLEHVNFDTNYPAEYARFSFMIAEKERENLSRDIHDGILQDQLRLYRKIEVREKKETNEEFKVTLRQIREQIMDHIYITRETCNNLRPPFLEELGLEKALLNLIKKINREANFLLDYKIEKELRIHNSEISHCIYRVTQELLNNAIKHSQATVVKLRLFEQNNYLCLYYVDDGIGMGIGKQVGDLRSTIGIPGVIARVRGLHGAVSIDSTQGSGVRIKIKFNKDSVYK
ncbi:sensor histidine kinase [Bacillus cereus]|uniref:sensor histidine kinase n=1 Tax=Bacillus cereus TaxID=1396 RepID=UPI000BEB8EC1|nr:ATP-binding protein [Bacillus cereus]PEE60883.1 two-component sensor histidine kinase [Bacillus cereus]PFB16337.1 two-component sensor histidine kinase [Bacillus cereus]PFC61782.1 two-component sensor histidine kinase [Bacillus cereus]PFD05332.1 two-component sensor histidine kinase [Bacillus cereus]PFW04173.1 two-component sensor histidine kinase [Bacillus cereus]